MARELWTGNEALAEAAIRAGLEAYFGYPITPQTELLEYMARRMPELDRVFVQAESEIGGDQHGLRRGLRGGARHDVLVIARHQPDAGRAQLHRRQRSCLRDRGHHARRAGPGQYPASQSDYFQVTKGGRARRLPPDRAGARLGAGSG